MLARLSFVAAAAVVFLGLAGCGPGRLDETKTFTLDMKAEELKMFHTARQSVEQKLTVEVTADNEVDVYVIATKDEEAFVGSIGYKGRSAKSLGSKEKIKSDTLSVTVPPNTEVSVAVDLGSNTTTPTQVKLRMTNKP